MKNKILVLAVIFMFVISTKVFAAEDPSVEAKIIGKIEKGSNIQILINISGIKNFYAGAFEFKYNTQILKVNSIEKGNLLTDNKLDKMDVPSKIDEQKGMASYGFTFLGRVDGISGSGNFVKLNAEIMKVDNFHIKGKTGIITPDDDYNLKLQLVTPANDGGVTELNYNFIPYEFSVAGSPNSGSNGNTTNTNTANTNITSSNNKEETNITTGNTASNNNTTTNQSNESNIPDNNETKNTHTSENSSNNSKGTEDNKISSKGNLKKSSGLAFVLTGTVGVLVISALGVYLFIRKRKSISSGDSLDA